MATRNSGDPEVVIVGAGPYGLSIAAHLRQRGVDFRIFGASMATWTAAMPKGMFLKSEGAASNLSDPNGSWTLACHCREDGVPYGGEHAPVPLEVFTNYGRTFQRRFVPMLEETEVVSLSGSPLAFELRLRSGEIVRSRKVVVSVGTTYFKNVPMSVAHLPKELLSHSAHHSDLGTFKGQQVIIIGGGQSALETAALVHERGGEASVLVRSSSLEWHPAPSAPTPRPMLRPNSGLGRGWRSWFYCNGPSAFQYLPRDLRLWIVGRALGPAGAWWLKDRVVGHIPLLLEHVVEEAVVERDRVRLRVRTGGQPKELVAQHVIAATGYKVDVNELTFIDLSLRRALRCARTAPLLSRTFQSSVQGLYFAGLASASQFGPAMRFVYGADYTARKIAAALSSRTAKGRTPGTIAASGREYNWGSDLTSG
jgi:FAD-dependent urate hydroxylase